MSSPIESAAARRAISPQQAREQSAAYHGFAASVDIQIGDDVFEIPNPSLLDDDQQERYNELNSKIERECDHEDDIVIAERTLEDGTVMPSRTLPGELKQPYTIKGEPLKPAYNTQLAVALFGEPRYLQFKSGGGRSNQIALIWGEMQAQYDERKKSDPKSDGGAETSAPLSDGNGVGPVAVPPPADS